MRVVVILLALTIPGAAHAACTVTSLRPFAGFTASQSPTFKWTGTCTSWRVQFSPSGTFTAVDTTSTHFSTAKTFKYGEATWDSMQDGAWAAGVYWRVQGDDGAGAITNGLKRSLMMDPNIDDDGYSVGAGDCNDDDATIFPGATELCDGVDNNCDGTLDSPIAETCDGLDNDCDGVNDEDHACVPADCAYYEHTYGGHVYFICTESLPDWEGVRERCASVGFDMFTITDAAENEWVRSTFGALAFLGLEGDGAGGWWWENGEPLDYTYWWGGVPTPGTTMAWYYPVPSPYWASSTKEGVLAYTTCESRN